MRKIIVGIIVVCVFIFFIGCQIGHFEKDGIVSAISISQDWSGSYTKIYLEDGTHLIMEGTIKLEIGRKYHFTGFRDPRFLVDSITSVKD